MTAALVWLTLVDADAGDVPATGPDVDDLVRDRFLGLEYVERAHGVDRCTIRLDNRDMRLHDDPLFRAGQALEVAWGYDWQMSIPHRVTVKKGRGDHPYEVVCFGALGDLDGDLVRRVFHNRTDDAIVREVLTRAKWAGGVDVEPTRGTRESVTQKTSDARFLYKLAERNGYILWVDGDGVHFRDRDLGAVPSHRIVYGTDPAFGQVLTRPDIQMDVARDLVRCTVWSRDPDQGKLLGATYGPLEAGDEVSLGLVEEVGDPDDLGSERERRVTRTVDRNIGVATEDERVAAARAMYRLRTLGRYALEASLAGDPTVRPRQVHEWEGLADAYAGLWWTETVTTTVGETGYRTNVRGLRDALGKLYTATARPVRRKPNQAEAEKGTYDPDDPNLKRIPTWYFENGVPHRAWIFRDSAGNEGGERPLTAEEAAQLSPEDRAAFEAGERNFPREAA